MAAVAGALLAVAPAATPADASGLVTCEATPLTVTVLSSPPLTPVSAGVGRPACENLTRSLSDVPGGLPALGAPLPMAATAVGATTAASGDRSQASAEGAVTGLSVGSAPLAGQLLTPVDQSLQPTLQGVAAAVNAQLSPITTALNLATLGHAGTPTLGVQPLVDQVNGVLGGQIASSLLAADTLDGKAAARCVDGAPALTGTSDAAGVSVLGRALNLDQPVDDVPYIDAQQLDLQQIVDAQDLLTAIKLPDGSSLQQQLAALGPVAGLQSTVTTTLAAVVASLPAIAVPQQVVRATIARNVQTAGPDELTQEALKLRLSLLGQGLLDLVAGQARISTRSVTCAQPAAPVRPAAVKPQGVRTSIDSSVAASALACTGRAVALTDVVQRGNRTFMQGAARSVYAGRAVDLYLAATGKKVASTKVGPDGLFQATAPLPPARLRGTNAARYYAVVQANRSQALKFHRRLMAETVRGASGTIRMSGTVSGPKLRAPSAVVIKRRLSCGHYVIVKRIRPDAHGRFSVTITPPKVSGAVVYRAQTRVPATRGNHRKLFQTFTLPRIVAL